MTGITQRYEALLETGELRDDVQQRAAVAQLQRLQDELLASRAGSSGFFSRLFSRKSEKPRGIYMWGGVGRGKSMLMDLFHETLASERKRRVHFHEFMLEVHSLLRDARNEERGDPIPDVAERIASGIDCLAFDEMFVTNSADAMIMGRLFTRLILEHGLAIVTTSNRPPRDLYKDGLNREHFLPFIELIGQEMEVVELNGPTDYRLERLGGMPTWYSPVNAETTEQVREVFFRLTDFPPEDSANVPSADLSVGGTRTLHVPKSLKGVAVFSFKRLCKEARGASDYLAIARAYHTVFVMWIPRMGRENRNEAARFVTLIDALYEHRVKLIASAETEPEQLYESGDGSFEFQRTVSRLNEMRSADYLALGHGTGEV